MIKYFLILSFSLCFLLFCFQKSYAQIDTNLRDKGVIKESITKLDSIQLGSSLLIYTERGDTSNVLLTLELGANINFKNNYSATPLLIACEKGYLEIAKILLYYQANPNAAAYDGFTPLMFAAYQGNLDLAELLIFYQADLNKMDNKGYTALNYATVLGDFVMADMLMFYGADSALTTFDGNTNLLLASYANNSKLVKLFFDKNIDIQQKNRNGFTPLSISIHNNYNEISYQLLDLGANPYATSNKSFSALTEAVFYGNNALINLIFQKYPVNDTSKSEAIESLKMAKLCCKPAAAKLIRKQGVKLSAAPIFGSYFFGYETQFNSDDLFHRFHFGIQDYRYNLSLAVSYESRLKEKTVMKEFSDVLFWQIKERRNGVGFELKKKFCLNGFDDNSFGAFAALDMHLMWGSYAGLEEKPRTKMMFAPKIGAYARLNFVEFNAFYVYTPYNLSGISNHRFGIGMLCHISNFKKPQKYSIPWLEE